MFIQVEIFPVAQASVSTGKLVLVLVHCMNDTIVYRVFRCMLNYMLHDILYYDCMLFHYVSAVYMQLPLIYRSNNVYEDIRYEF